MAVVDLFEETNRVMVAEQIIKNQNTVVSLSSKAALMTPARRQWCLAKKIEVFVKASITRPNLIEKVALKSNDHVICEG